MTGIFQPQFAWPLRVYYEDSDAGGVVYHSNYLNFMERARTEWLRSLGFEQTELRDQLNVLFVVRSLQLQYKKPAKFNDAITVESTIQHMGRSLLTFEQRILRGDGQLLTTATVEVACLQADSMKPTRIPPIMQQAFKKLVLDASTIA